jgi:hypothetical protein
MSTGVCRLSGTAFGSLNIIQFDKFVITTTGAATATLPNGFEGQTVYIVLMVDGGDLVVTSDFNGTSTTATFADAADSLSLMYLSNSGWVTTSNQGSVVFA